MENIKLNKNFTQVCIWPGTIVGTDKIKEFEKYILEDFGVRVQYLEEIKTKSDVNDLTTGGRNDLFFAVHNEDIGKFSVARLHAGIRWIEDVLSSTNGYSENPIYPERVLNYKTWEC